MMEKQRAFTLVELIIAMALLTIILVSLYPIILNTRQVNEISEKTLRAEILAQEHLEYWIHESTETPELTFFDKIKESNFNYGVDTSKDPETIILKTQSNEDQLILSAIATIDKESE